MKANLKILFVCSISLMAYVTNYSQVNNDTLQYYLPVNVDLDKALAISDEFNVQMVDFRVALDTDSVYVDKELWYYMRTLGEVPPIDLISDEGFTKMEVYGPFGDDFQDAKDQVQSESIEPLSEIVATEESPFNSVTIEGIQEEGLYLMKVQNVSEVSRIDIVPQAPLAAKINNRKVIDPPLECTNCLDGEMPATGDYLISVWISVSDQESATSFVGPSISVTTSSGTTTISPDPTRYSIDGWQLMEGHFTMPSGSTVFSITLNCNSTSGTNCFFDDIRFMPDKASMKTYVYDPYSLRLVAELDERHYSTLYEYDEDGQLKRVKKETERGVKTIQETNTSTVKRP